jgi:hypothetical protein
MNFLRSASRTLNRGNDVVVGPTAADISAHTFAHISVILPARFFQQRGCGHNLAGGAVAALKPVMLQESGLDRMQIAVLCQTFDGRNSVALMHDGKSEA